MTSCSSNSPQREATTKEEGHSGDTNHFYTFNTTTIFFHLEDTISIDYYLQSLQEEHFKLTTI